MPFDIPHQPPVGDLHTLLDARGRISDQRSWLKGGFQNGHRHCLVGALSLACGSRTFDTPSRTERRLVRLLAKHLPPKAPLWVRVSLLPARYRLMLFNDHRRTTHDDVLALFDRTIFTVATEVPVHASL